MHREREPSRATASGEMTASGNPEHPIPMDSPAKNPGENRSSEKEEAEPPKHGFCVRLLAELQCIIVSENDDQEQDPFSRRRLVFIFGIAVLAIVVNLIVIPISLANMENKKNEIPPTVQPTSQPTLQPTLSPTFFGETRSPTTNEPSSQPSTPATASLPTPTHMPSSSALPLPTQASPVSFGNAIDLPPYTLEALNDPNSPQSRAFQWISQDPNLSSYNPSRKRQRMALATFFYSTNENYHNNVPSQTQTQTQDGLDPDIFSNLFDDNSPSPPGALWTNASHWLSYDVHECVWFSRAPFACDSQQSYRHLALNNNGLAGRLPPEVGLLTDLEQLQLSNNLQLYGNLPAQLELLTQLVSLQLSTLPQLSGTIPSTLGNLHATLQTIDLRETPFFPKIIPTQLGRLTNLQQLLLDTRINTGSGSTTRAGTLPTEMGTMVSLRAFTITGKEVVGQLPPQLAGLSQLEWLLVSNTQVTGPIPPQYGNLQRLATLDLAHNQLSSTLPAELAFLGKTLTSLGLNDNSLTGTIPIQYSNLTHCKTMSFQKNQLTGSVPLGMCYLLTNNIIYVLQVDCRGSASSAVIECSCGCDCF